ARERLRGSGGRGHAREIRRDALSREEHRPHRHPRAAADAAHEPQGPVAALHARQAMTLKVGLLGFWTLWFAIVTATNVFGVSSNYAAIVRATQKYSPPHWLPRILFAAVIAWQAATTALLARAVWLSLAHDAVDPAAATLALGC